MVMANALAVRIGALEQNDADQIVALLAQVGLPVRYRLNDPEAFYDHFFLDKKSQRGRLRFVLPDGAIGTHRIRDGISRDDLLSVLATFKGAS
jgi:3-dehydroquinate synthase